MSDSSTNVKRRMLELLADRAAFGLKTREEQELCQLLRAVPNFDADCMERAAATAHLALTSVEPIPADVRSRLRAIGLRYIGTDHDVRVSQLGPASVSRKA